MELTDDNNPPIPAATVILVDDGPEGLEVLMLRRNSKLAFAGGAWVFPGGRVDEADLGDDPSDVLTAARRAAVREAAEEAGILIEPHDLVPFSNWTPPAMAPKRFSTWFFIGPDPGGRITVDDGEIEAHQRVRPIEALERHRAGEIELVPPTWVTLDKLCQFESVEAALATCRSWEPEHFVTQIGFDGDTLVAMWHGDAGHATGDHAAPGPRHRLVMAPDGWTYVRDG